MTTDNINKLVVIIETDDGKLRQLITKKDNRTTLLKAIFRIEGELVITEETVEGITFE